MDNIQSPQTDVLYGATVQTMSRNGEFRGIFSEYAEAVFCKEQILQNCSLWQLANLQM